LGSIKKMNNSSIKFDGMNNILYCEKGLTLDKANIVFNGDNSIIYLSRNVYSQVFISVYTGNVIYIGRHNYFNPDGIKYIVASENKHIFIGNYNLFSVNTSIRNSDAHLIYDIETRRRTNLGKSIYLGDKIWINQDVTFLKNAKVHSGCVVGTKSVVTSELFSNAVYAGVPAKCKKKNVFWNFKCVHPWNSEDTKNYEYNNQNDDLLEYKKSEYISYEDIEKYFEDNPDTSVRLEYLISFSHKHQSKNRFTLTENITKNS